MFCRHLVSSAPDPHGNFADRIRDAASETPQREVFPDVFLQYLAVEEAHNQGDSQQYLPLGEVAPRTLPWTASVRNPHSFQALR